MACISLLLCYRAGDTGGLGAIPIFCVAKEKKKKEEEKKVSMRKLLKDSPMSKMSLY